MKTDETVNSIPAPGGMICKTCADFRQGHDGIIICHCEHFSTGAIFSPRLGYWRLYSPVSRELFDREIIAGLAKASAQMTSVGGTH